MIITSTFQNASRGSVSNHSRFRARTSQTSVLEKLSYHRQERTNGMKNSHSQNNSTELGTVFPIYLGSFGVQRLVEHNNNALETQGFFDLKRVRQDLVYGRHISRRSVNSGELTYAIFCDHVLVSHQNIESTPARNGLVFTGMKARQKP